MTLSCCLIRIKKSGGEEKSFFLSKSDMRKFFLTDAKQMKNIPSFFLLCWHTFMTTCCKILSDIPTPNK
jgi:hypothetical protein